MLDAAEPPPVLPAYRAVAVGPRATCFPRATPGPERLSQMHGAVGPLAKTENSITVLDPNVQHNRMLGIRQRYAPVPFTGSPTKPPRDAQTPAIPKTFKHPRKSCARGE